MALLQVEEFIGSVLDPFCGGGSIVSVCLEHGIPASGSDLYEHGFGERRDAFDIREPFDNLLANPPFSEIEKIIPHFLLLVRRKLVLLARINILEAQRRLPLFRASPPARVWVSSRRASIPPGDLTRPRDRFGALIPAPASGGTTTYCWLVWDRDYAGSTVLNWF